MRLVMALILAVALGAAAPPKEVDDDPASLIAAIYKTYADIAPGEEGMPGLPGIYSKRLQALLDKDARETQDGMVGRIDWDVFVDGQDWQLSELKIEPVSLDAAKAQIRASFKNFGEPKNMLFDLVREEGGWRIDEIAATLPPRWIMSKILADDPGAFPDAAPEATPEK